MMIEGTKWEGTPIELLHEQFVGTPFVFQCRVIGGPFDGSDWLPAEDACIPDLFCVVQVGELLYTYRRGIFDAWIHVGTCAWGTAIELPPEGEFDEPPF